MTVSVGYDLGNTMGIAIVVDDEVVYFDSHNCLPTKHDNRTRWHVCHNHIEMTLETAAQMAMREQTDLQVGFEEVSFNGRPRSTTVWGGYRAVLEMACNEAGLVPKGIQVPSLKKYATNNGAASKADMIEAASKLAGVCDNVTSDEADAIFVALWAQQ